MKWFNLSRDMSRRDAKLIKKYMQEIIDDYGYVTLADLYNLMGGTIDVATKIL